MDKKCVLSRYMALDGGLRKLSCKHTRLGRQQAGRKAGLGWGGSLELFKRSWGSFNARSLRTPEIRDSAPGKKWGRHRRKRYQSIIIGSNKHEVRTMRECTHEPDSHDRKNTSAPNKKHSELGARRISLYSEISVN